MGGGDSKTVQRVEPNKEALPLYQKLLSQGESLYDTYNPQYFPGQTVTPFSPETNQGFAMQMARGTNGSPLVQSAGGYVGDVLGGKYLNEGNPYMQGMADRITQQVNSQMGGRAGVSGAYATALGDSLVPLYYNNYRDERNAMGQAVGQAQSLAQEDYRDIAAVRDVGQAREMKSQDYINDAIKRWEFEQNKPFDKLEFLKSLVWGDPYKSQVGSAPQSSNPLAGLLGGLGYGLIGAL